MRIGKNLTRVELQCIRDRNGSCRVKWQTLATSFLDYIFASPPRVHFASSTPAFCIWTPLSHTLGYAEGQVSLLRVQEPINNRPEQLNANLWSDCER
jgi:hypothetical protein